MPVYVAPGNDLARLAFLKTAAATAARDILAGNLYITQATVDAMVVFVPQLETNLIEVIQKLTSGAKEVREKNDATDLDVLVQAGQTEKGDVAIAVREYDQAEEELAGLRIQTYDLIVNVMAQLRYVLRWLNALSHRRIMRTHGADFVYLESGLPDEQAPPEP